MEYRGPLPDIDIPDVTLYELLFEHLTDAEASGLALLDHATRARLTFGEVKAQVDALATWLAAAGIGPGDAVAIDLPNCVEYAGAFHGIVRSGAAATPISTAASAHEIARQLQVTGARRVITCAPLLPAVEAAAALAGLAASDIVVLTDEAADAGGHVRWTAVLATPPALPDLAIDPATHVACLPFSSGTSGLPKAVMLSHRNLVANLLQFNEVLLPVSEDASLVAYLPYSHIYSLTTNLNYALYRRCAQYTMAKFDPAEFLTIISVYHPGIMFVVPPVAAFLAKHPSVDAADLSSLRIFIAGAAPLDGSVGAALNARTGIRVVQGFGMTELSPVTHVIPMHRTDIDVATIGLAIPNVRFRVVDPETGQDVAPAAPGEESAPGELWCTGPNAMLGYLGHTEEDPTLDADGWVHTGDLVTVDHEGVVRVVGRIKELIKRRGMQVAPAELEAVLTSHPAVADAAVLGVPSRVAGEEVPHALVVLRPDAEATAGELIAYVTERVAPYKRLGGVHFIEKVPRSGADKIVRRDLPALLPRR